MMSTNKLLISISFVFLCSACDSNEPKGKESATPPDKAAGGVVADRQESPSGALSPDRVFDKQITKQPCDLLTPALMAEVAGVDAADLEQRNIAGMCLYSWEGGQGSLGHLRTSKTTEFARQSFENSYRNQTPEEIKKGMEAISAEVEKQSAEGKIDASPEQVKMVTGGIAGAFQYEEIPGLGDAASFEVTRTETSIGGHTFIAYANSLNVLVGNLKFTVSYNLDGEPRIYREDNISLAKAVLGQLPD